MQGPKNRPYIKGRDLSSVCVDWEMGYEHLLLEPGVAHDPKKPVCLSVVEGASPLLFEGGMMGKRRPRVNYMHLISPINPCKTPSGVLAQFPFNNGYYLELIIVHS